MEKRNSFRGKSASGSSPRGNRSGGRAENGHRTSNDRREGRASNNGDSTRRSSAPAWREKKDDTGKRPFSGPRDAQSKFVKKSPKGSSWKGLRDRSAKPEGESRGERFDAASSSRERRPFSAGRDEKRPAGREEKKEFGRHKSEMPARGERRSFGAERRSWDGRGNQSQEEGRGHNDSREFRGKNDGGFNSGRRFEKKPVQEAKPRLSETDPDKIRLNRFIANSGVCSRRDADALIQNGEIYVNGKVVTVLGTIISKEDEVTYKGKVLDAQKKVYILLNKPKDVVTTMEDPEERLTVMDLIRDACEERVYPVGRLDRQTTGLLLFTNDGDLAKKLTHPKHDCRKIYHVITDKPILEEHLEEIAAGVTLEDGLIQADKISFVDPLDKCQAGIEIHSGKNRIVRRLFEHFGYQVQKLDRVYFAGLTKQGIPRGKWRLLNEKEISKLKAGFFK
ncbi:pseudouridine synthase [candidate division KSB1 bacterium]|nr:MAG: pseudouridine synthase [candidate division KSB1 bacterium]